MRNSESNTLVQLSPLVAVKIPMAARGHAINRGSGKEVDLQVAVLGSHIMIDHRLVGGQFNAEWATPESRLPHRLGATMSPNGGQTVHLSAM